MDEDAVRLPWEDKAPEASRPLAGAGDLLIPLARAQEEQGGEGPLADDHLVANALAYARLWRRLAALATVQPLASVDSLAAPLHQRSAAAASR